MSAAPEAGDETREQARAVLQLVQGFVGHDASAETECTWCPLCRAARALRTDRPEVVDHLTDATVKFLDAVKSLSAAIDAAAAEVARDGASE